ncbi:MAG TPA: S8 family serine peptidase [Pyrinomonadaceae bacterium]|jgi:subtilisin family serine protease|nr:S8 family serine peptidase [Pyrinomonadaceae bacterium]
MKSLPRSIYLTLLILALGLSTIPTANFSGTQVSAQSVTKRYVIIYHQQNAIPLTAESKVASMGGTVLARLPEIGVLVATSSNPKFADELANADQKIADIAEDMEVQMIPSPETMNLQAITANPAGDGPVEPAGDDTQTGPDPFYNPFQWDKKRIRASNQGSYPVQQGRPDVVVAVLDTGAQVLPNPHPDLQANLDTARSRSFFPVQPSPNGDPNPVAWDDRNGHGSHCMSNVGAPINGIGMVGVAPRVRLVALKVLGDNGSGSFVSLAQALVYAGVNKFDVASMSLSGYIPRSNQGAHVLLKLVQRAVNFARSNGVTPVAALGNDGFNVSDGDFFRDFLTVPAEVDGVIGVSATGFTNLKAVYSNYGVGKTDVSGPGGDFAATQTPHFGLVLGAWAPDSTTLPGANYALAAGTSMACPQAAGVCALIISQYGDFTPDNSQKLHMSPQEVESILQQTANNQPCPPVYTPTQTCQGNAGYNNFYGKGIVDAFKAVTEGPGQ